MPHRTWVPLEGSHPAKHWGCPPRTRGRWLRSSRLSRLRGPQECRVVASDASMLVRIRSEFSPIERLRFRGQSELLHHCKIIARRVVVDDFSISRFVAFSGVNLS